MTTLSRYWIGPHRPVFGRSTSRYNFNAMFRDGEASYQAFDRYLGDGYKLMPDNYRARIYSSTNSGGEPYTAFLDSSNNLSTDFNFTFEYGDGYTSTGFPLRTEAELTDAYVIVNGFRIFYSYKKLSDNLIRPGLLKVDLSEPMKVRYASDIVAIFNAHGDLGIGLYNDTGQEHVFYRPSSDGLSTEAFLTLSRTASYDSSKITIANGFSTEYLVPTGFTAACLAPDIPRLTQSRLLDFAGELNRTRTYDPATRILSFQLNGESVNLSGVSQDEYNTIVRVLPAFVFSIFEEGYDYARSRIGT